MCMYDLSCTSLSSQEPPDLGINSTVQTHLGSLQWADAVQAVELDEQGVRVLGHMGSILGQQRQQQLHLPLPPDRMSVGCPGFEPVRHHLNNPGGLAHVLVQALRALRASLRHARGVGGLSRLDYANGMPGKAVQLQHSKRPSKPQALAGWCRGTCYIPGKPPSMHSEPAVPQD